MICSAARNCVIRVYNEGSEVGMRRRSRRAPNTSESTGKIGQQLPSNQPAPLVPLYPDDVQAAPAPQRRPDDRPNRIFQRLQEKLGALPQPEFGTMTAREFFLYESKLSPAGSQYTQLQRFPLL